MIAKEDYKIPMQYHKDRNGRITYLRAESFYEAFCFQWEGKGSPPSEDSKQFQRFYKRETKWEREAREHEGQAIVPPEKWNLFVGATI